MARYFIDLRDAGGMIPAKILFGSGALDEIVPCATTLVRHDMPSSQMELFR
jgi:hypothetical protein